MKYQKITISLAIILVTIATLYINSNDQITQILFKKHTISKTNLKGSINLFTIEQNGYLNKAQKCLQKETINQGCGAYASENAADDLEVITDFQRNYADNAEEVIKYSDKCFKNYNPDFWKCMDGVYKTCITEKDNAAELQKNNIGLQDFPEIAPNLYNEECVCQMKYTDIPKKQDLILKIAKNNDYIDVKSDLTKLAKDSKYFQCVNNLFEVIPQFHEKAFSNINKVCDAQFSTRIKQQDRLNLHSLITFSEGKNVGYTEIRKEILDKKYTKDSDYFSCLLKKVDNNLPVSKYATPLFAKLNNEKCDKKLDITKDLTGETKLLIIDLAEKSKKFTTYDQYNDALVAEKMDSRSEYYQCLETTLFENWQFVQLTEKSFKPLNGKCDKKFKSIPEQEQFNHFYEQINKNKVNTYLELNKEFLDFKFNTQLESFKCYQEQIFENYPVETFSESKLFGKLNKDIDSKCKKSFFDTPEKQTFNSFVELINNQKSQTWVTLNDELNKNAKTFNSNSKFFQCFQENVDSEYPIETLSNKTFAKMNKTCDKDLKTANEKEEFNAFIESVNKNKKTTQYQDLYDQFKEDKQLNIGSSYYQCYSEQINKTWVFEELTNKQFQSINKVCDSKLINVKDKETYNKFIVQMNQQNKQDFQTLNSEFIKQKFNPQQDFYKCYQEKIFENYPVETFSESKLFGKLNKDIDSKCKKSFYDTPEKQTFNNFVELINKQKSQSWVTLNDELNKNAKTFNSNSKFFQCFQENVDSEYPIETLSNKTFIKMNKTCDKDLKTANEKEEFNAFIESVNKNKKTTQYEDLYDQFTADQKLNKGADYYSCFAEQINKTWVFEQLTEKSFKPINGACDSKFTNVEDKEAYNKFVVEVNQSKKSDYVFLTDQFNKYKFNTKSDYYSCVQSAILKNYPVEQFSAKQFAGFSKKCATTFDSIQEKQAFNSFVESVNKDKKVNDLETLFSAYKLTKPDQKAPYVKCFEQEMLDNYPLTKFTNKDFAVLNGKCEKEFTAVQQKKTFNSFVDTINDNDKTWEQFYSDFKKESSFFETKSKEYACMEKEILNDYPVTAYTNKVLVKEFTACIKSSEFSSVEQKQAYNKFVDAVNKNSKITDLRTFNTQFTAEKEFQSSKEKYVQCINKDILADYPISEFTQKDFAAKLNNKCNKKFSTVVEKESYDKFVDAANKAKTSTWAALNTLFTAQKFSKTDDKDIVSCVQPIITTEAAAEKKAADEKAAKDKAAKDKAAKDKAAKDKAAKDQAAKDQAAKDKAAKDKAKNSSKH